MLFVVIIPAMIIYFRIRKKVKSGFAVGMIVTSVLLSLFTFYEPDNTISDFYKQINSQSFSDAKLSLKKIVQKGQKYFLLVDKSKIDNPKVFKKMKNDIAIEYNSILKKIFNRLPGEKVKCIKKTEVNLDLFNLNRVYTYYYTLTDKNYYSEVKKNNIVKKVKKMLKHLPDCSK